MYLYGQRLCKLNLDQYGVGLMGAGCYTMSFCFLANRRCNLNSHQSKRTLQRNSRINSSFYLFQFFFYQKSFYFFKREFQSMASALNDNFLSSYQDINQFLTELNLGSLIQPSDILLSALIRTYKIFSFLNG